MEPLRQGGVRFDLDRLERLEEVHQMSPAEYRESWAWVHLMLRSTPQANKALLDWAKARGLALDRQDSPNGDAFGARYESYLIDPAGEPDPEKWETEVAIRLADRQASR